MAENDYAVVIGINRYPNMPDSDLDGPERDAEEFRKWLISDKGGHLKDDKDHVHFLLSSGFGAPADASAARPNIVDADTAFKQIIKHVENSGQAGRRLYMFFAGHGIAPRTNILTPTDHEESAVLMANAEVGFMGDNIPGHAYAESLGAKALFKEIILFMDCCRDACPKVIFHPPIWDSPDKQDARDVKFFYGFATKWSLQAREMPLPPDGKVRGIFSHALMSALWSGRLTASELKGLIYKYATELMGGHTDPPLDITDKDAIIFSEGVPNAVFPVRVTFALQTIGHEVEVENGRFEIVRTCQATATPWDLSLEPGWYRIHDRASDSRVRFEVVMGGTIDVKF